MRSSRLISVVLVAALAAARCGGSGTTVTFAKPGVITDLGSLDGPDGQSIGWFVNDRGDVIGGSAPAFTSPYDNVFRWTRDGGLEDLSDAITLAMGLSETGDVVGHVYYPEAPNDPHPVLVRGHTHIQLSDSLGSAVAVNDLGRVVGCEPDMGMADGRCWTWDAGDVEMLPDSIRANAINNQGEIVGFPRDLRDPDQRGMRLRGKELRRIPTFGGRGSVPVDIDEQGRVVGLADRADRTYLAFAQNPGGSLHNLGSLDDYISDAAALNEHGVVVGTTTVDEDDGTIGSTAFIYHPSIGMRALEDFLPPDSGWVLETALDINESNQIVGQGSRGQTFRGYLLDLSVTGSPAFGPGT